MFMNFLIFLQVNAFGLEFEIQAYKFIALVRILLLLPRFLYFELFQACLIFILLDIKFILFINLI